MGFKKAICAELSLLSNKIGRFEKVLDVGCGSRIYEQCIRTDSYIGIDVEDGGHNLAAKKHDLLFDGISIPFPDNTFDLVLSTEVLEYVHDDEKLCKEMVRVLRPDGYIFVSVPSMWGELDGEADFRRYTSTGTKALFANLPVVIVNLKRESPGFISLIKLGLSEINIGKNNVLQRYISRSYLLFSYVLFRYVFKIDMPRIFLSNLILLQKSGNNLD